MSMRRERRGGSVREKKWKEKSMMKERRGVSVREKEESSGRPHALEIKVVKWKT
jgi:hypothetical protein